VRSPELQHRFLPNNTSTHTEGGANNMKQKKTSKPTEKKAVIATRRTCKATGVGLSHYVMPEAKK